MLPFVIFISALLSCALLRCDAAPDPYPVLTDEYVTIDDTDGTTFQLRRLEVTGQLASCYEARRANNRFGFCYPAINIIGMPKCGTSAMYQFLVGHKGFRGANPDKEYCPQKSLFDYFFGLAKVYPYKGELLVNGCISPEKNHAINTLLRPKTANIMMVRNFADRLWAIHNFWCSKSLDVDCRGGGWTKEGMYRTPEMFHELLLSRDSPQSEIYPYSCGHIAHSYTESIRRFGTDGVQPPHVVSIEALSALDRDDHVRRLQDYINAALNTNTSLQIQNLHRVNAGDEKGPTVIAHNSEEGVYKISGHRPMLPESVARISSCWRECRNISAITHYDYHCV
jgi:hypothetical protein